MDIPDSQLYLLLQLYNGAVGKVSWNYVVKVSPKKPFKEYPWYKDLVNLYNIIQSNGLKAREYLALQVSSYRRATRFSRVVPSIRMLTTPAALEVWSKSKERVSAKAPSIDALDRLSEKYMRDLMQMNNLDSTEDFFKDPLLIREVSRDFLRKQPEFNRLLLAGYYKEHFGMENCDIL